MQNDQNMSLWQKEYILKSSDVDAMQRLRISRLFVMLQEAAIAHTTELGMGREKTLDKGLLWIITLLQVRIVRLPVYDEKIRLESWPGKTMHLYFPRYSKITDAKGETLIESSMLWTLIDRESRKMVFPEEHGIVIAESAVYPALPFPKGPVLRDAAKSGEFTVPYSYTDLNGHMNNTRYFDLAEDCMDPQLRKRSISGISAQFSAEVPEGAGLELFTVPEADAFSMEGRIEDKSCFKLKMIYS